MFTLLTALIIHLLTPEGRGQVVFTSSNLPIVVINTRGQTIIDEAKITADMGIIDNGPGQRNNLTDPFNNYDGLIGIEIRGSSSQSFPKKQYAVETRLDNGENNNVSLLGLPAENDWILYAPYSDKSLMRNVIAYTLSLQIGRYASRNRFCEVVINGDYKGIYVLMEKIKRDKNRVNIKKMSDQDTAYPQVSGGYIVKIDKRDGENVGGWYSPFPPYASASQRIFYQYHYPKPDEIIPEQIQYIQDFIHRFELAMLSTEFADPLRGYPAFINLSSFVDHFILNEIGKNVDGYRLSAFMYKDRDDRGTHMYMGPIWDFNLAFGNADYYQGQYPQGWQADFRGYGDSFQIPFWWLKLRSDWSFSGQLLSRWTELRQTILSDAHFLQMIDSLRVLLDEAKDRDFVRWPRLGTYVWPNPYVFDTYDEEVAYLKSWILDRNEWMDAILFDQIAPSGVTGLSLAGVTSSTVSLSWQPAADNFQVIAYDIFSGNTRVQSTPYTSTTIRNLDENTPYQFTVKARDCAGNHSQANPSISCQTSVFTPAHGYLALKTAASPVIDGWQDDLWESHAWAELDNVISGSVSSEQDLSARFKLCWDDERIYLFIAVRDDVRIRDSGTTISDDDGLELYIDLDNSKDSSYGMDDFKYRFAYGDSTVIERVHNAINGVQFVMLDSEDGYHTEISVPWATLGKPPQANALIGFEVQVNDDDDGGSRDAKIAWWGKTDIAHQNPSAFGTIKLKNPNTGINDSDHLPRQMVLYQNYPNPFNPVTAISYRLSALSQVDLSIYNMQGQKIATLVSARQPSGNYQVVWDASSHNLASGIYFYRLSASDGWHETKRMLLLK